MLDHEFFFERVDLWKYHRLWRKPFRKSVYERQVLDDGWKCIFNFRILLGVQTFCMHISNRHQIEPHELPRPLGFLCLHFVYLSAHIKQIRFYSLAMKSTKLWLWLCTEVDVYVALQLRAFIYTQRRRRSSKWNCQPTHLFTALQWSRYYCFRSIFLENFDE